MIHPSKKYRPYFTLSELEFLSKAVRTSSVSENEIPPIDLLRYLERFIEDIRTGFRQENLSLSPRQSIEQRLGLEDLPTETNIPRNPKLDGAALYLAWRANYTLNLAEVTAVQEYKYLNDLMTPKEEAAYELAQGIKN